MHALSYPLPRLDGNGQECSGDPGIELDPGELPNLLDRDLDGEGRPIRTVGGHGVERVDDREDPGPQGDLLALEPARVAGSVPPLLVTQDDVQGGLQEADVL